MLLALLLCAAGCRDDAVLGMGCVSADDCEAGQICVNQACISDNQGPVRLDGGGAVHADARWPDAKPGSGDGGTTGTDGGNTSSDGGNTSSDGGNAVSDGGHGRNDGSATLRDTGHHTGNDAGGGSNPVAQGVYDFTRIITPGIPSNAYLTALAVSPDDRRVAVAERYDTVHILDIASATATISVALPKDGSELLLVEDVAYAGSELLIAATVSASSEGRLYRAGRDGGQLSEVQRAANVAFRAIAVDAVTGAVALLGSRRIGGGYAVYVYRYVQGSLQTPSVQGGLSAGCQDAAWVDDGLGGRGVLYVCGENGAAAGIFDSTSVFVPGPSPGQIGNLPRVAARPSGDYALGVHRERVYRFEQGVWSTGFGSPAWGRAANWTARFSQDGRRALAAGDYANGQAELREYRHDLYSTAEIRDVSIPGFNQSPYLGVAGVHFDDVAWRPTGDCGFIAGGCSSGSCRRGYLLAFRVLNGRACP